ncbi:putative reverse transcriptase domain-containing protein, partial [Tanacetum coccineum]
ALPLPPLPPPLYIPPPVDHRDDIPESEQPPGKRLCLSTLSSRYEIRESSTARPTGDPAEAVPEITPMTVGEVNARVIEHAELHEHDTQDLYALLEDVQDSRSRISQRVDMDSQRVDLLMGDRMTLQETVWMVEEEAYASREAWAHSIGLSQATHQELQTHRDHTQHQVYEARFQTQLAEISALRESGRRPQEQMGRARQPGPDAMITDHQDASRDADSHRNSTNGDASHSSHGDDQRNVQTARPCYYADFMKCQPLNFKGTEGVVSLTWWIEKMESIFNISGCAIENQVKFATCTLLGAALTWWDGQIRTLGPEAYAMTWEGLKKKMTDKYCPLAEIQKLEIELWNLKFCANETEKINKYIRGLPDNIYGNVKSSKPKTLDETIELANDLMNQKLRTYTEKSDNKRKADESSRNNHGHQQQPFKKQNTARVYNMGTAPKGNGCFECGAPGHFKRDCLKLKNKDEGNRNAQGWVYVVGNAEKRGNASGNPDSNVIT